MCTDQVRQTVLAKKANVKRLHHKMQLQYGGRAGKLGPVCSVQKQQKGQYFFGDPISIKTMRRGVRVNIPQHAGHELFPADVFTVEFQLFVVRSRVSSEHTRIFQTQASRTRLYAGCGVFLMDHRSMDLDDSCLLPARVSVSCQSLKPMDIGQTMDTSGEFSKLFAG